MIWQSAPKHLTTTAKVPHKWAFHHDEIGYNYRMPNLNAALGVAQLAQLATRLVQKRASGAALHRRLYSGAEGVAVFMQSDPAPRRTTG